MSPVRGEAIPALLERQAKLRDEVKALKRELSEALKDAAKWKRHAQALAQGKHLPEAP